MMDIESSSRRDFNVSAVCDLRLIMLKGRVDVKYTIHQIIEWKTQTTVNQLPINHQCILKLFSVIDGISTLFVTLSG